MNFRRVTGQAMTEFLISASFVLVPLFLGMSLLGKYIDIKQATIQSARYEAWEYTVWWNGADGNDILDNFAGTGITSGGLPMKSTAQVQMESRRRFFSTINETNTLPILSTDKTIGWQTANANNLWKDHQGNRLFDQSVNNATSVIATQNSTPTSITIAGLTLPDIGSVFQFMLDVLDFAFSAVDFLLGLVGSDVGFSAINTNGYVTSQVSVPVQISRTMVDADTMAGVPRQVVGANILPFTAQAGVLSDAWNTGGTFHTYNQAAGAVPTVLLKELLNNPVLDVVWQVISLLAPELSDCNGFAANLYNVNGGKGSLWFGHVDSDAIHPDRLSADAGATRLGGHTCNDAGMCDFDPTVDPATKDCIP